MNKFTINYYKKVAINGTIFFGLPVGVGHAMGLGVLFPYSALIAVGFLLLFGPLLFSFKNDLFNNLPETIKSNIVTSVMCCTVFMLCTFLTLMELNMSHVYMFNVWATIAIFAESLFAFGVSLWHVKTRNKFNKKALV